MNLDKIKLALEKRGRFILVLLTLVGFAGGLMFATARFGVEPDESVVSAKPPRVEMDFSVLKSDEFEELEVFEGSTEPEEKGREEPFEPYEYEEEAGEEEAAEEVPVELTEPEE